MSDLYFPTLPGLAWDLKPVPKWSTVTQRSKNDAVTALSSDPMPLWTFELSYEFIRANRVRENRSEIECIVGFYNQMRGGADTFLLDPSCLLGKGGMGAVMETQVHGSQIGVGDGATTTFYLQREYGGFSEEVQTPIGAVSIAVNGVAVTTGITFGALGEVTFGTAPASGAVITADFQWVYRARFAEDTIDLSAFMYALFELQSLKLEAVKQ